ncbi:hypothetical protein IFM47457_07193 [Aspergillus lentulus]|uniref:N-acetylgalactosaminide beta-1,3-galactosyltransferase n=1 Tax=Aspergillus lentulus TaxID=293939 RepID=A0ABQ1AJM0_ASPLE|nr:hypothetical protein IFM62136_06589 [Aspergillus lentulus]GFF83097.1 hypothetical protein IFM60648_06577 [Aspergillus lentulus]GFF86549.1 hypothetical protein IFM47457_07193 [Aspergillus lentulus]
MYLNNATRVLTAAFRGTSSFADRMSEYWQSWPKKRQKHAFVVVVTVVLFCLGLKLGSDLFYAHYWDRTTISSFPNTPYVDYWEWETTTRFSNAHSANETQENSGGEDLCGSFPSYHLSRVQVVLKIGSTEPPNRVDTHLATVTRCITNLIVVSDHESEINGHHVHDILATLPESFWGNSPDFKAYSALQRGEYKTVGGSQGWTLDKYKFLPMVERAYEMNPTAQWFVFIESDTYVVWDNVFRLLGQFDPSVPLYFGSPTPGKDHSFFAYGGAGFVLSTAAVQRLVTRMGETNGVYSQPSLSQRYKWLINKDCCGDSILGWALYQSGVKLSGMWPMFNPHPVHGVPFNEHHWCQPVISMHKLSLEDMAGLARWENQRDRKLPLLYADLFEYTKLGTLDYKTDWDNGDWGGWQEPPESPGHKSVEACAEACHEHPRCFSYTYVHSGRCVFVPSMRLGAQKPATKDTTLSAGWDLEKIKQFRDTHKCQRPQWVKPSTERIF